MNRLIAAAVVALISVTSAVAADYGDPAKAQSIANQICAACHGADGNSPLPMNPSLAGQHPEYLFKQLNEFKSGNRNNAVMMGMVAGLSAEDMRNLSAYYAAQKLREAAAKDKDLVAHGRKLFRGGNLATGVAACAGCHSPNGAGIPSQYPRLAGQHPEYVVAQLKAFRAGERANDTNNMMRAVAARLTDKEIAAVAEYLSGLR
ncbi:MAG TPA: c-type cytochrome [Burkholderiales bacterium]|jgi:cytochrome c553|nr:c-type cytochrome [Burkholderiales bacterium]